MISVFGNSFGEEELNLLKSVFDSHLVGTGSLVTEFENRFSELIGFNYAAATNSCTNTFWLLFKVLKLSEKDEVIIPNIHFFAIKGVLQLLGIKYTVTDVDPITPNISLNNLKKHITSNTKAIVFLEYGGHPLDIQEIKDYLATIGRSEIHLILDAANSPFTRQHNKYTATNYDFAVYSFDMNKILVTGDGGMLLSNNKSVIESVSELSYYGIQGAKKSAFEKSKTSSRWWGVGKTLPSLKLSMNNIAAAIGLVQLGKIPKFLEKRQLVKDFYYKHLSNISKITLPNITNAKNDVYLFWILLDDRDYLAQSLLKKNIYSTVKYTPLDKDAVTPNTFTFYEKSLCLPMNQNLTDDELEHIVESVKCIIG